MRAARTRGSLLITALIFSALIAIALLSFLRLAAQSTTLSYRSFYAGASMNAAETGLEQAMWAINKRSGGNTTVWSDTGWTTLSSGAVRRTFDLGTLSGGATAQVKVFVSSANLVGSRPFVLARSIITPKQGPSIERWINITLSRRSRFSTGLVAKDLITFSGNNASVDSYDSRLGDYTPSSTANRFDRGTAGSASVRADTFNLGNADIWGYAVVGTSNASGLDVGSQGTVGPFGTAQGTVLSSNVMTDFTANFEDVSQPGAYTGTGTYTIASISGNFTLPRPATTTTTSNGNGNGNGNGNTTTVTTPGDTPAADGKYYYNISEIDLASGGGTLTIADNVVIRMVPSTGTVIKVSGQGSIVVNAASGSITPKVEIFTEADVSISGNGVANAGKPINFMLWGTRPQTSTTAQTIDINGNGVLSSVVYAPNAKISMNGGGNSGNVYGSMVGKTVSVTGNSAFHYDESLADLDASAPFGMDDWNEYVSYADRSTNATYVNF